MSATLHMRRPKAPRKLIKRAPHGRALRPRTQRRGMALIVALIAITIFSVLLAELQETTSSSLLVSTSARDQLKAEYLAKSSINLTRLLVRQEPQLRQTVAPMYQMFFGRPPPQLNVWSCADDALKIFTDYKGAEATAAESGISLTLAKGVGDTGGTCEIHAMAENSMININDPLRLDGDPARLNVALQLFALLGGYQPQSPFNPLFEQLDPDGQNTSRDDIVSGVIDWWDSDTERTSFDPAEAKVTNSGSEDDIYRRYKDPYEVKNAPFDSIEELRLIRGVGDDFWATFIEPSPDDPESRTVTIYGSGSVNPNEARPEVVLARLCSFVPTQPLCNDPLEAQKFITLVSTAQQMFPLPPFSRVDDFLAFMQGKGGEKDLYPMLVGYLGPDNPLLFKPITLPDDKKASIGQAFVTAAQILSVEATCHVGRTRTRIRTVVNFHDRWTPPPPNTGTVPGLGIFHYYRVE